MIKYIVRKITRLRYRLFAKKERKLDQIDLKKGIIQRYERVYGITLDLDNPKTFAEKINWLKLHYRNPRIIECADKYLVRDFVKKCIGDKYLIPILGVWDRAEEVNFDDLPNSFVLKPNNSSGRVLICKDKSKFDTKNAVKVMKAWENENLTKLTGEWFYEKIPFKIVCEEFLEENITDYKMYYADGQFIATQLILDREEGHKSFLYMDNEWNKLDIRRRGMPTFSGVPLKPVLYDEMIDIANKLSKDFVFCRVDLYCVKNKIYFGELSFYPNNGFVCYETQQMDDYFSNKIKLARVENTNV